MLGGLGSVFSLLLSLVFIIVLVIVSIRLLGRQSGMRVNQRLVRVVAVIPLGTNKTLQVIVVGIKRIIVVGVGNQIEQLANFEDEDLANELLQASSYTSSTTKGISLIQGLSIIGRLFQSRKRESVKSAMKMESQTIDEWGSVQERLEYLRMRRNDVLKDADETENGSIDSSFQDILTDLSRRSK